MKIRTTTIILLACLLAFTMVSCEEEPQLTDEAQIVLDGFTALGYAESVLFNLAEEAYEVMLNSEYCSMDSTSKIYSILPAGTEAGYTLDNSDVETNGLENGKYILRGPGFEAEIRSENDDADEYLMRDNVKITSPTFGTLSSQKRVSPERVITIRFDCNTPFSADDITLKEAHYQYTRGADGVERTEISLKTSDDHNLKIVFHETETEFIVDSATLDGRDIKDKVSKPTYGEDPEE